MKLFVVSLQHLPFGLITILYLQMKFKFQKIPVSLNLFLDLLGGDYTVSFLSPEKQRHCRYAVLLFGAQSKRENLLFGQLSTSI